MNFQIDPKNALIILNPASGTGDRQKQKEQIVQYAKSLGWKGELHETTRKRSSGLIAEVAIKRGIKHIIVCGGDGTIMDALPAILNSKAVLGIVPLGTGNLFAQNLNMNLSLQQAVETALNGHIELIDIGKANNTLFAVMAGIGFDAEVMRKAKRTLKSKYGFFAYIVTGLKHLKRSSGLYEVVIDGKKPKRYRAKSIVFANMGKIQGGIEAVPNAHYKNGVLRIAIIKASSIGSWLNLLANAITGDINNSPHYELLEGKKAEITSLRGAKPYECDGDHFPPTKHLIVEIFPKALPVVTS